MRDVQTQLNNLEEAIKTLESNLSQLKAAAASLSDQISRPDYSEIPGKTGYFDGSYMVTADNEKFPVNENYSAKSRILYGDNLKMIEEDGKTIFKLIDKQEKEKVEGVLNKKDGKWYLLTDKGTYRISDVAASFNDATLQDKARALIPEGKHSVPFAALDKVYKDAEEVVTETNSSKVSEDSTTVDLKNDSSEKEISLNTNSTQEGNEVSSVQDKKLEIEAPDKTEELPAPNNVSEEDTESVVESDQEVASKNADENPIKTDTPEVGTESVLDSADNPNASNLDDSDKTDRVVEDFDLR